MCCHTKKMRRRQEEWRDAYFIKHSITYVISSKQNNSGNDDNNTSKKQRDDNNNANNQLDEDTNSYIRMTLHSRTL